MLVSEGRSKTEANDEEIVGRIAVREQDRVEEARCTAKRHSASPLRSHVLSLRVAHRDRSGEKSARAGDHRQRDVTSWEIRSRARSQSRCESHVARAAHRRQLRERGLSR